MSPTDSETDMTTDACNEAQNPLTPGGSHQANQSSTYPAQELDTPTATQDGDSQAPASPCPPGEPQLSRANDAPQEADQSAGKPTKSTRATRKATQKQARKTQLQEARAAGQPPPSPCPKCKGDHWLPCPNPHTTTTPPQEKSTPSQPVPPPQQPPDQRSTPATTPIAGTFTPGTQPNDKKRRNEGIEKPPGKKRTTQEDKQAAKGDGLPRPPPRVTLTRRTELGQNASVPLVLFDGTWLYMKLPKELRNSPNLVPAEIIDAVLRDG